jgi:hypothetical protein
VEDSLAGSANRLGVALVREIADLCGGGLTAKDRPGHGKLYTLLVRAPA